MDRENFTEYGLKHMRKRTRIQTLEILKRLKKREKELCLGRGKLADLNSTQSSPFMFSALKIAAYWSIIKHLKGILTNRLQTTIWKHHKNQALWWTVPLLCIRLAKNVKPVFKISHTAQLISWRVFLRQDSVMSPSLYLKSNPQP